MGIKYYKFGKYKLGIGWSTLYDFTNAWGIVLDRNYARKFHVYFKLTGKYRNLYGIFF